MFDFAEYRRRNNVTLCAIARGLEINPRTIYNWLNKGEIPPARIEQLLALEARKAAAGEWPQKSKRGEKVEQYRASIAYARSRRSPEGIARAAAKGGAYLAAHPATARENSRWSVCKRNYADVAAAELASAGRRLGWPTFYANTFKTERGTFRFEGKKQSYEFD